MTMDVAEAERAAESGPSIRLSELLFIELLRQYAASPAEKPVGWLTGVGDPAVARALSAIHDEPARAWTVEDLARIAAISRSAFAARFRERIGLAPMRFVAAWRMQLAAADLRESDAPIAEIGSRYGYASEAAFSPGFKKISGMSPDAWRRDDV